MNIKLEEIERIIKEVSTSAEWLDDEEYDNVRDRFSLWAGIQAFHTGQAHYKKNMKKAMEIHVTVHRVLFHVDASVAEKAMSTYLECLLGTDFEYHCDGTKNGVPLNLER